jgi:hypothetical protein
MQEAYGRGARVATPAALPANSIVPDDVLTWLLRSRGTSSSTGAIGARLAAGMQERRSSFTGTALLRDAPS